MKLILSLFPGIGLLDMAFEQVFDGIAAIVRGPDLLWGGDIQRFHVPAGHFWGIIGGPPCQAFSRLRYLNPLCGAKQGNQIPQYERVCTEAQPDWFLMENVPDAPEPVVAGYVVHSQIYNNRWAGGEQNRLRRFSFGTQEGRALRPDVALLEAPLRAYAVTSSERVVPVALIRDGKGGHKRKRALGGPTILGGHSAAPGQRDGGLVMSLELMCELQGLPPDYLDGAPFTCHGKRKVVGNGVPLPMGLALAEAVKRAMGA
mgnify:CR=1 FL=1